VTVGEYLEHWLSRIKEDKRATTWRGYESAVRLHITPVLGTKRLEKLTGADVRQLVAVSRRKCLCCVNVYDKHRPEEKKCCSVGRCCRRHPSTRQIQYIHAVPRNALSSAMRDELVTRNVAKLVQIPAPRYKVGKRVAGELLVDETKSEASDATVPLPKVTRRALVEHLEAQEKERVDAGEIWRENGLVFPTSIGTPKEPRSLNRHFDRVRAKAGLPGVRLHDFRHTVVSLLLELRTPPHVVKAIARHADIDVTMSIYAHTDLDAMRETLDKIDWEDE
jgi:hypothetical protein